MSTKTLFSQTFIKDAGSFVIPVLIVLIALIFAAGNRFSVNAAETPQPAPAIVTVSGGSTVTVSGSAGVNLP